VNEISAYVNTVMFMDAEISFHTKEGTRKVLVILDVHRSYCSDVNVLDFTAEDDVILLYLPNHTMHYLQPMD
jgi:hypothetical protein